MPIIMPGKKFQSGSSTPSLAVSDSVYSHYPLYQDYTDETGNNFQIVQTTGSPTFSGDYLTFGPPSSHDGISHLDATAYSNLKNASTMIMWFRSTTSSGDNLARLINIDPTYWAVTLIQNQNSPQPIRVYQSNQANSAINTNQWYMLTVRLDNGTLTVGLDDSPNFLATSYPTNTNQMVGIGIDIESNSFRNEGPFTGHIRDLVTYDKVLTDSEVITMSNNPPTPLP